MITVMDPFPQKDLDSQAIFFLKLPTSQSPLELPKNQNATPVSQEELILSYITC